MVIRWMWLGVFYLTTRKVHSVLDLPCWLDFFNYNYWNQYYILNEKFFDQFFLKKLRVSILYNSYEHFNVEIRLDDNNGEICSAAHWHIYQFDTVMVFNHRIVVFIEEHQSSAPFLYVSHITTHFVSKRIRSRKKCVFLIFYTINANMILYKYRIPIFSEGAVAIPTYRISKNDFNKILVFYYMHFHCQHKYVV